MAFARYLYDERGDLVAATDADGYTARFAYDEDHRMTLDVDRAGLAFHFIYDAKGRCVESWGDYQGKRDPSLAGDLPRQLADGVTRVKGIHHNRFFYGDGGYSEVSDSTQVRRFFGNQRGLLDKRVDAGGVTTVAYDAQGFMLSRTDASGATVTFDRDRRGRLLRATDPLGHTTSLTRDAAGLEVEVVDPKGGVTRFDRDPFGNILAITDALGGVTAVRYDERGLPLEVMDPTGGRGHIAYDAHGNVIAVTQANGGVWRYAYDAFGRRVQTTDPLGGTVRNVWSDRGDLLAQHDATGGVSRFEYDGEGHLIRCVSPSGAVTTYTWGGYHRLSTKRDANGDTIQLRYNLEGELVLVKNGRGEEHRLARDSNGRLVGETTFDGRSYTYKLDRLGRVVRVRDTAGDRVEYVYNAAGELTERSFADEVKETFAYDAFGELIEAEGPAGVFRFERDALGRVVRETQLVAHDEQAVESEYDALGRRIARRTSRGHVEVIERDAVGSRVRTLLDGSFEVRHVSDLVGREIERLLPGGGRVVSAFDAEGRLGRRTAFDTGASRGVARDEPAWIGARREGVTADKTYRYGLDGDLIEAADVQRGSTQYQYDPVGRLLAMVPPDARPHLYRHDRAGNLHEGEGGAGRKYERDRLIERGDTTYRWDAEGRLLEKRRVSAAGVTSTWSYAWNAAGQLWRIEGPSGLVVEFSYDPMARRIEKRSSHRAAPGERPVVITRPRFVWDGDVLVHEIRETARRSGDPILEERTYCFEDDSFEPALQRVGTKRDDVAASSSWFSYMNDPAGAPDRLIASDGTVACEIERSAWGRGRIEPNSSTTTPFGLQGQYEDAETGLAYNRFRYYDAEAGRFISPDPMGLAGGVHPYTYAANVQTWVDPLGLTPLKPVLLGQTMGSRVTPTAEANGWHTFKVKSTFKPGDAGAEEAWTKNQKRWMRDQLDSGRKIYDIGDDPKRSDRSKYCAMEHQVLKEEGFTRVCTGKTMMVDGVATPLHEWVPPAAWKPGDGKKRRMKK